MAEDFTGINKTVNRATELFKLVVFQCDGLGIYFGRYFSVIYFITIFRQNIEKIKFELHVCRLLKQFKNHWPVNLIPPSVRKLKSVTLSLKRRKS